jgi:hypothetical protein
MKLLPVAAVSTAAVLSALALSDAALNALTPSGAAPWDPEGASELMLRAVNLLHGIPYLLLAAVLMTYRRQIDQDSRALPWLRNILAGCYAILGLFFSFAGLFAPRLGTETPEWLSAAIFVPFLGSFIIAIPLGLLLLKHHRMQLSGWLLASPIIVLPLTIVLESTSRWAHPAYLETVINLGTALISVAATSRRSADSSTPAHATAANNA